MFTPQQLVLIASKNRLYIPIGLEPEVVLDQAYSKGSIDQTVIMTDKPTLLYFYDRVASLRMTKDCLGNKFDLSSADCTRCTSSKFCSFLQNLPSKESLIEELYMKKAKKTAVAPANETVVAQTVAPANETVVAQTVAPANETVVAQTVAPANETVPVIAPANETVVAQTVAPANETVPVIAPANEAPTQLEVAEALRLIDELSQKIEQVRTVLTKSKISGTKDVEVWNSLLKSFEDAYKEKGVLSLEMWKECSGIPTEVVVSYLQSRKLYKPAKTRENVLLQLKRLFGLAK